MSPRRSSTPRRRATPEKPTKSITLVQVLVIAIPLALGAIGTYVKGEVRDNHLEEQLTNALEKITKLENGQVQNQNNYLINRQGRTAEIKAITDDITAIKVDLGITKSKIADLSEDINEQHRK